MTSGIRYDEIPWEDEDTGFDEEPQKKSSEEEQDFSKMLGEESFETPEIRVGHKVEGLISSIGESTGDVLVDLGGFETAVLDRSEITNEDGTLKFGPGDRISAYVRSRSGAEIQLSMSLSQSKQAIDDLYAALHNKLPVRGKVVKENKGGFEVTVLGKSAFCPVSQIDARFVQNKQEYIGRDFEFLIEKIEAGGRNIVVSRAALLREQAARMLEDLEARLSESPILDGVVTETRDYGAFVDLGGIEGFVHVSEISHARVNRVTDFLTRGEKVRVKVLKIEEKDGKKRVSLSIKAALEDPWTTAAEEFKELGTYPGRVTRLENYGAFVELKPGIEGLVHISEMSWEKRILHPREVVQVNDQVKVRVLSIDSEHQKISLSLKDIESDPWQGMDEKLPVGKTLTGKVERLKGFGAIVEIMAGVTGLLPIGVLKKVHGEAYKRVASPPKDIEVKVVSVDPSERKVLLSLPQVEADDADASAYRDYLAEEQEKKPERSASSHQGTFGALLAKKLSEKPGR